MTDGGPRRVLTAAAFLLSAGAAVAVGSSPLIGSAAVVTAIAAAVVLIYPLAGVAAVAATLLLGQLVRVSAFGVEGAILPSDAAVAGVIVGWILRGLIARRLEFVRSPISWPIAAMIVVFLLTFLAGTAQLPFVSGHQRLGAFLYFLRWLEFPLLLFAVADLVRTERSVRIVTGLLLASAAGLAVLGFVQLKLFPDFRFMVPQGWDPHIGRLLSTWFDPNFLAGFLTIALCLAAGLAVEPSSRRRIVLLVLVSILFAAVVLTFSRSGYAAFLAGVGTLTLFRARRLAVLLVAVVVAAAFFVPRVNERVVGAFNLDATARLRLVSWQNALTVVGDYPVTGIGYNAYRYVQVNYGFLDDPTEHSAGGSDSSLLTILVTTGPVGLAAMLWLLWSMWSLAWDSARRGATALARGLGIGLLGAVSSLIVHSLFINSLLYPHTLIGLALGFGALLGARHAKRGQA